MKKDKIIVVDTSITTNLAIKLAIENPNKEIIYYQIDNPETSSEIYYTILNFDKLFPNLKRVSLNFEPYLDKKRVDYIVVGDINMGDTWEDLKKKGFRIINGSKIEEFEIYRSKFKEFYKKKKIDVIPPTWYCKNISEAIEIVKKEINDDEGFVFKVDGIIRDDTFHTRIFRNKFFGLEWLEDHKDYEVSCIIEKYVNGIEIAITGYCGKNGFIDYVVLNIEDKQAISDCEELLVGQSASLDWIINKYKDGNRKYIRFYEKILLPLEDYLVNNNYIGYFDVNCIYDYKKDKIYVLEATCGRFGSPSQNIFECLLNISWTEFFNLLLDGDKFSKYDFTTYDIEINKGLYALTITINQEDYHDKPKSTNKKIYGYTKKDILFRGNLLGEEQKYEKIFYTPFNMWYDTNNKCFRCVENAGRIIVATYMTNKGNLSEARKKLRNNIYEKIYVPNMFVKKELSFEQKMNELYNKIKKII